MNEETAKMIIAGGAAVGVVFWCIGVWLYRSMAGAPVIRKFEGEVVDAPAAEVLRRIVANSQVVNLQAVVSRPSEDRLSISLFGGIDVKFEATRARGGSHIVAEVDDSRLTRRYLAGMAALVLILMPAVIGGVALGLWHYVAPHASLGVRWQAVQIVQIVHVLWPQFVVYYRWNAARRQADTLVSNALVLAQLGER